MGFPRPNSLGRTSRLDHLFLKVVQRRGRHGRVQLGAAQEFGASLAHRVEPVVLGQDVYLRTTTHDLETGIVRKLDLEAPVPQKREL
ncbi:MAG: hypothetical protein ABJA77_05875 [Variovorax sp.]